MNIGIIGFGNMGKAHAFSVENLKYFYNDIDFDPVLYGVAASSAESAAAYAEGYGFKRAFSSPEELIRSPEVDVVDICAPNVYHYDFLKAALECGKNIYCEKPLTGFRDSSVEICSLAKKGKSVCGVVFNTRFLLPVVRAKELINDGALGRILSFNISFLHSSALTPYATGWKQDKNICGGGVLVDLGSHAADLALYLCGNISHVSGKSQIAFPKRLSRDGGEYKITNADEAFYMTATLDSGAVGQICVSKIHAGTNDDFSFEIYGERGALRFSLMEPNWLRYYDSSENGMKTGFTKIECVGRYPSPSSGFPGQKAPVGWLRGQLGSMHSFLRCVSDKTEFTPSFYDAARAECVIEAAYRSDNSQREERVNYF